MHSDQLLKVWFSNSSPLPPKKTKTKQNVNLWKSSVWKYDPKTILSLPYIKKFNWAPWVNFELSPSKFPTYCHIFDVSSDRKTLKICKYIIIEYKMTFIIYLQNLKIYEEEASKWTFGMIFELIRKRWMWENLMAENRALLH